MSDDIEKSLSDEATFAGVAKPLRPEMSLSDERTLGGSEEDGIETVIDDIEAVDLEARYRIVGTLGQGGMGAVLLATDTRLDRKVAIKRIIGEAARSATAIQRFLTEAKAIAALNHPNIVQIYDYGRAKDGPFLIMEHVDGGSLADRCKQGALPLEEAIDLACQLCDGLAKAHDAGIIHRDIKPANVLLSKDKLPKLTDFGLAKSENSDHGMTMTGAVMGTPDFMPPEQRRDASLVDARSDIWSLAATVYQMVTGRSPKIIRFDQLPSSLTGVFGKALEDEKDARYQTARDFRDALRAGTQTEEKPSEDIGEGQCPACGVKNDSSRRFCRGCGESLEVPCLSCAQPMPMWEEICGSCGEKQSPILKARTQEIALEKTKAEGYLGDLEFDIANRIATTIQNEKHPRLQQQVSWASHLLEQIENARQGQIANALLLIDEAVKHEAEHDYISAALTLEAVPDSLRQKTLPRARESVADAIQRVRTKQSEVRRLSAMIKKSIAEKQHAGLLEAAEQLLTLKPKNNDIHKLREKLLALKERRIQHRHKAVATAQGLFDARKYQEAIQTISTIDSEYQTDSSRALARRAQEAIDKIGALRANIQRLVASNDYDSLTPELEEYLRLKPDDEKANNLLKKVRTKERIDSLAAVSVKKQAEEEFRKGRIVTAIEILSGIPEKHKTQEIEYFISSLSDMNGMRNDAMRSIAENLNRQKYELSREVLDYMKALAAHGVDDLELQQKVDQIDSHQLAQTKTANLSIVYKSLAVFFGISGLFIVVTHESITATVIAVIIAMAITWFIAANGKLS